MEQNHRRVQSYQKPFSSLAHSLRLCLYLPSCSDRWRESKICATSPNKVSHTSLTLLLRTANGFLLLPQPLAGSQRPEWTLFLSSTATAHRYTAVGMHPVRPSSKLSCRQALCRLVSTPGAGCPGSTRGISAFPLRSRFKLVLPLWGCVQDHRVGSQANSVLPVSARFTSQPPFAIEL